VAADQGVSWREMFVPLAVSDNQNNYMYVQGEDEYADGDGICPDGFPGFGMMPDPQTLVASWAIIEDATDRVQTASVEIELDEQAYTATFVYGKFNEIFTDDPDLCGENLEHICTMGDQEANNYTDRIIGALSHDKVIDELKTHDQFYIPFEPLGDLIRVKFDRLSAPASDDCCDIGVVSRVEDHWWVRFTPDTLPPPPPPDRPRVCRFL
ncbi:MAG: hypothetical protein AAF446_07920, partial [Pseudomonadota bacterium]